MAESKTRVATILGWKCCCDIELQPTEAGALLGLGFSGKDETGSKFEISLTDSSEGSQISVRISSDGKQLDLVDTSATNSAIFTFDAGNFFGDSEILDAGIPRSQLVIIIGGHAELKRSFRNYSFGLSYMPVVWEMFKNNPPKTIFEWGPGRSTIFFAELFPKAEIIGVEHNSRWFSNCQQLMSTFGTRVEIEHRHLAISPGKAEPYVTSPLWKPDRKYDLVFIDGRLRCDCTVVAKQSLTSTGTVLVHDAHRKVYQLAYELYSNFEIAYNTAILSNT